jgi:hypothetical protein
VPQSAADPAIGTGGKHTTRQPHQKPSPQGRPARSNTETSLVGNPKLDYHYIEMRGDNYAEL